MMHTTKHNYYTDSSKSNHFSRIHTDKMNLPMLSEDSKELDAPITLDELYTADKLTGEHSQELTGSLLS